MKANVFTNGRVFFILELNKSNLINSLVPGEEIDERTDARVSQLEGRFCSSLKEKSFKTLHRKASRILEYVQ